MYHNIACVRILQCSYLVGGADIVCHLTHTNIIGIIQRASHLSDGMAFVGLAINKRNYVLGALLKDITRRTYKVYLDSTGTCVFEFLHDLLVVCVCMTESRHILRIDHENLALKNE